MKNLLIDPVKQTISPIEFPPVRGLKHYYDAIGCDCIEIADLHHNGVLIADENGWANAFQSDSSLAGGRGFFVVMNSAGLPYDLIPGRALVGAVNEDGYLTTILEEITPEYMARFIRFIPPAHHSDAIKLGEELLADCGWVRSHEHANAIAIRHQNIMQRALALCIN